MTALSTTMGSPIHTGPCLAVSPALVAAARRPAIGCGAAVDAAVDRDGGDHVALAVDGAVLIVLGVDCGRAAHRRRTGGVSGRGKKLQPGPGAAAQGAGAGASRAAAHQ